MPLPRPAPGQLRWWVVGVVGVGLGTALVTWYALALHAQTVTAQVVSYKVSGDEEVTVTFDVTRPGDGAVTCRVVALDERFGTVGARDFVLPRGPERAVHRVMTLRTTHRAVSADVKGCRFTP